MNVATSCQVRLLADGHALAEERFGLGEGIGREQRQAERSFEVFAPKCSQALDVLQSEQFLLSTDLRVF